MEGVLLVVVYYSGWDRKAMTESCEGKGNLCYEAGISTGFAPGSIYGLTLFYVHGYFAVCAILDPVRSLVRSLF